MGRGGESVAPSAGSRYYLVRRCSPAPPPQERGPESAGEPPAHGARAPIEWLLARDHYVFGRCQAAGVAVAVAMSGGYAPDVDDIVRIHVNTVRTAAARAVSWPSTAA